MADAKRCPNCGARRAANAPEGLCPRCLMHYALGETPIPVDAGLSPEPTERDPGATWEQTSGPTDTAGDRTVEEGGATIDAAGLAGAMSLSRGATVRYFGDYEIKKELGRGGMGVVYDAVQMSLNRPVALKMIRAGILADDAELRRFQNEAEAVATLDHPGIVPIYEVGEHEGQRYFSMKRIDGKGLDRSLGDYAGDPASAARLVAATAAAIHHAHQRGILHRDLKPANVLVDARGEPHVTDFGLAKRVEGGSELTISGAIMGTPAYMAPEQASGGRGAVTTQTDVYGLGAILYAVLTGRAPFGGTSVLETLEHVRERPPESPRKLNPRVPRDLELICLKCLEKDARRRYASADALAEDLRRFLAGEPIEARPVGAPTRLLMWCRRKPVVAGAVCLAAAAIVSSFFAVVIEGARRQEEIARKEAETNFEMAQKAFEDYLTSISENVFLREQDSLEIRSLRADLLKSALTFYERFAAQRKDNPRLRQQLANAYFRVGQIAREIGSQTQALSAFRSALAIWRPLVEADPKHNGLAGNLAECDLAIGKLESSNGDFSAALGNLGRSRAILERLSSENATEPRYQTSLADCYSEIGIALAKLNKPGESLEIHHKARMIQQRLIERYPDNLAYKKGLAENLNAIGFALHKGENNTDALNKFLEVRDICEALMVGVSAGPKPTWLLNLLALSQYNIGVIHKQQGELEKALPFFEESIKYQKGLADLHPSVTKFREKLGMSYREIAGLEHQAGQDDKEISWIKMAIDVYSDLVRSQPEAAGFQNTLAWCWDDLGLRLDEARKHAEATVAFEHAVSEQRAAITKSKSADGYRLNLCYYLDNLGRQSVGLGRAALGLPHYREAVRMRRELSRAHPEDRRYTVELVNALGTLGNIERHMGDAEAARPVFAGARKAVEEALKATPGDPALEVQLAVALASEAAALADLVQTEKARVLLEDAAARFRRTAGREAPAGEMAFERERRSETLWDLARVLRGLKLPLEADRVDAERIELWKDRAPEELVELALTHLAQATMIGHGKTPLSAQAEAVRELDLEQAAGEVKLAISRGLKDLGKLNAAPESSLLLSREDVKSAMKVLSSADAPL